MGPFKWCSVFDLPGIAQYTIAARYRTYLFFN